MKPPPFTYHRPETTDEAVALLAELGQEAKPLAGGQSLIPLLALRLTAFDHLIDVGRIPELAGIELDVGGETVRIGAVTRQATVQRSHVVRTALPLLAQATVHIGHRQIRNRGTFGGAVAHADPAGESPTVALTLDAVVEARSPRGTRTIPAADFFTGTWSTVLESDELLTAVDLPVWSGRSGFAVREFARRSGDFAIAGAMVGVELDPDDRVRRCRIGLFGLGRQPERGFGAEESATGTAVADIDPDELGTAVTDALDGIRGDLHGSVRYRRRIGAVMVSRAWSAAVEEALHD